MAQVYRDTRVISHRDDVVEADRPAWTLARVVYLIAGILIALLLFRFLLSLLGANRGNPFANFIYDTTRPFVAPFFGLFNYHTQFGVARFEGETLVAAIVYGLIAWVVVRLLTINSRTETDV